MASLTFPVLLNTYLLLEEQDTNGEDMFASVEEDDEGEVEQKLDCHI